MGHGFFVSGILFFILVFDNKMGIFKNYLRFVMKALIKPEKSPVAEPTMVHTPSMALGPLTSPHYNAILVWKEESLKA